MHRSFAYIPFVLLALVTALGYYYYRQLERLDTQLAYSTAVLTTANEQAIHTAHSNLRLIEATVEKNRNQPADIARLQKAKALHRQITWALASLHDCASTLYRLAGHATNIAEPRRQAYRPFTNTASLVAQRWQELRQQLVTCTESLRQASPAARLPAITLQSVVPATTVTQALADLALTEYQLTTAENVVLQNIDRALSQRKLVFEPLVLATAERTMVDPGDTYHARLLVAIHGPSDLRMDMACNGRSVPIDSHGMGQVHFRAPLRPGPATWTGTIRLSNYGYYGRDSTFKVTVPYRVARR
jgi:hypothetical protein